MADGDAYYHHSGKLTVAGVVLSFVVGFAAVVAFGPFAGTFKWIGTYFIDVGFFGLMAFAWLAGLVVGKVLKITRIRNERYCFWLGIVAGFALMLSAWFWFYVFLQIGDVAVATGLRDGVYFPWEAPERFFKLIHFYVFEDGKRGQLIALTVAVAFLTKVFVFTLEFPNLSGVWLYGLWIFEAVWMVVWTGFNCRQTAGEHGFVFCEACNQEAEILYKSPLLHAMPDEYDHVLNEFRDKLESGHFGEIETIRIAGKATDPGEFSRLILRGCETCRNLYCADIARVKAKWNSEDYRDTELEFTDNEDDLVIEHLLLPIKWVERLKAHFGENQNETGI